MVAFHLALRDIEYLSDAMIYPTIHTYREVSLGGGAVFPAVAFVNGWTLQFPAGNWVIRGGNLDCTINPVPGAYIERTQSAAYAVTSIGAGGATPADIATAVWGNQVEGTYTAEQIMRLMAAVLAGKVSGAGTGTEVFRAVNDSTDRVTISVTPEGNRTKVIANVI
jgi:hypothetical protein